MNEFLILMPAFIGGLLLGAFFYGGLWWTVRKGIAGKNSALIFSLSLFVRLGVALTGFYLVGQGDWRKLLLCLGGFIIARIVVTQLTRQAHGGIHAA